MIPVLIQWEIWLIKYYYMYKMQLSKAKIALFLENPTFPGEIYTKFEFFQKNIEKSYCNFHEMVLYSKGNLRLNVDSVNFSMEDDYNGTYK